MSSNSPVKVTAISAWSHATNTSIGGWDRETDQIDPNIVKQIEQAFDNVEHTLKLAGSRGWEDVFFLRSHHLPW